MCNSLGNFRTYENTYRFFNGIGILRPNTLFFFHQHPEPFVAVHEVGHRNDEADEKQLRGAKSK
jgi:hypothetical protein